MSYTVDTTGTVDADHNLVLKLPDVPPGDVRVTVSVGPDGTSDGMTAVEFADSEFFGMWADRDDLPRTDEEFAAWRKRLWDRSQG